MVIESVNMKLLSPFINATMSTKTISYVVGSTSSKKVWSTRETSNLQSDIFNLKTNLPSITNKADNESVDLYAKRIKEIKDKLANVCLVVNDNEYMFTYNMNRLSN